MKLLRFSFVFVFLLTLWSCANYAGSPVGGPMDKTPPVLIKAMPANHAVNYKGGKIKLEFDEYILLRDQGSIVSSPPLNSVDFLVNLKTLQIKIEDSLRPNTTYSLFFGSSIVDLNENNPLENFSYVFSSGSTVDSGCITGKVLDAYKVQPRENILVGAYTSWDAEFPSKKRPIYIAKTNKEGFFSLENMQKGCYQIAAISDENKNFILDLANEDFSFLEKCVQTQIQKDTNYSLTLNMYREALVQGNVEEFSFVNQGTIRVKFREGIYNFEAGLFSDGKKIETPLYYTWSKDAKSVEIKFKALSQAKIQMIERANHILDTLDLINTTSSTAFTPSPFEIKNSLSAVNLAVDSVYLTFSNPLDTSFLKKVKCINITKKDTNFDVKLTVIDFNKLRVDVNWLPECEYQLIVLDTTFSDIYGQKNKDTLSLKWKNNALEDYGAVAFTFKGLNPDYTYWMLRCDDKGEVLETTKVVEAKVFYPYLATEFYTYKLLEDRDGNGRFTSGDFLKKRLPEQYFIYPKSIKAEADWRVSEFWEL